MKDEGQNAKMRIHYYPIISAVSVSGMLYCVF